VDACSLLTRALATAAPHPLCSPPHRSDRSTRGDDTIATSTVATAQGPVATGSLGATLMHEHIVTRSPGVPENWRHLFDPPPLLAGAEGNMADLYARRIRTRGDPPPVEPGRDLD